MGVKFLRRYFLTGSLVVLPVVITIHLFIWLFKFIDGIFGSFINKFLMSYYGYSIFGLGIFLGIIIIFLAGFLASHFISKKVLSFFENWFIKFPIIKQIYPAVKEIFSFLFADRRRSFRNTVLIEYPRKGIYSIGFITNDGLKHFNEKTNKELINVFISSTPNPLTGYVVLVPKEEIIIVDVSIEDACKIIISGGVVNPSNGTPHGQARGTSMTHDS